MGIFGRFFGKGDKSDEPVEVVANPKLENPIGLQVLLTGGLPTDFGVVTTAIQSYHHLMASARCELNVAGDGTFLAIAGWGKHVVRLVGFDSPIPADVVETCVAPAHYDMPLKQRARAHSSHILLYYEGSAATPLEQYVALAAVAGAFASVDGIVALNEAGHTSIGVDFLSPPAIEGDRLHLLENLPLLFLYCGFVKYDVDGVEGVWMRSYGAARFGLPDLAVLAAGHHEAERYFNMFEMILGYLRNSGSTLSAGHTMQVGQTEYLRCRAATDTEYFLRDEDELVVVEIVGSG